MELLLHGQYATYSIYPEGCTISNISRGDYFYGEVTDSDSQKYPKNDFQNGYWYVLHYTGTPSSNGKAKFTVDGKEYEVPEGTKWKDIIENDTYKNNIFGDKDIICEGEYERYTSEKNALSYCSGTSWVGGVGVAFYNILELETNNSYVHAEDKIINGETYKLETSSLHISVAL